MDSRPKKRARDAAKKLQAGALPPRFPRAVDVEATPAARVAYCVRLMVAGRWQTAHTHAMLGQAWGVEPSTIRNYAAEASRIYKGLIGDEERGVLRALMADTFARIARKAERMRRLDWALSALELHGRYAGIEPTKITRSEITGEDGGPVKIASATAADARRLMREYFREVEPHGSDDGERALAPASDGDGAAPPSSPGS